jgi:plasmid stabilization system protein ParE
MAFRVSVTPEAEQDADEILNWLKEQKAGESGLRWFEGLTTAIASLIALPQRGALALENRSFPFELRQLLYGKRRRYRILYTIEGNTVFVLRIRRPGQQPLTSH